MKKEKTITFKDSTYKKLKHTRLILAIILVISALCFAFYAIYINSDIDLYFIIAFVVLILFMALVDFLLKPIVLNNSETRFKQFKIMVEKHLAFLIIISIIVFALFTERFRGLLAKIFTPLIEYLQYSIMYFSKLNISENIVLECEKQISYIVNLAEMQTQMIDIWLFVMTVFGTLLASKVYYFDKKTKKSLSENFKKFSYKKELEISEFFFKKLFTNIVLIFVITASIYFIFLHTTNKFSLIAFSNVNLITATSCKTSIYEILNSTILSHNFLFVGLAFFSIYFLIIKYIIMNIFAYLVVLGADIINLIFTKSK